MTFTYSESLATNRDKVRLLIQDTESSGALFSDEELCFLESEHGSATDIYPTALAAIDLAIVSLSRKAQSKSVGGLSINYGDRARSLTYARERIEILMRRKSGAPTPYAGGISVSDKTVDENDDDISRHFRVGQMDNPGGATDADLTDLRDIDRF